MTPSRKKTGGAVSRHLPLSSAPPKRRAREVSMEKHRHFYNVGCSVIPQPRVAQRTLGTRAATPAFDPERVGQGAAGLSDPFRVGGRGCPLDPGCAARPWAVESNPCGVKKRFPRVRCATLGCGV